jgi:hypothetical protein
MSSANSSKAKNAANMSNMPVADVDKDANYGSSPNANNTSNGGALSGFLSLLSSSSSKK